MKIIFFYIFIVIESSLHGFITKQHNDWLPFGLLAQSVERCTGIAEVMGLNPAGTGLKFFQALFYHFLSLCSLLRRLLSFTYIRGYSIGIFLFHILIRNGATQLLPMI